MKRLILYCMVLTTLFPLLSLAQNKILESLITAKSLECYFPIGTSANWSGDILKLEDDSISGTTHFDNIDIKTNKARMIGKAGAGEVTVLASASGLTFIESTATGNMIYTSIFPIHLGTKKLNASVETDSFIKSQLPMAFLAVTSRHILDSLISHLPMPSQFQGYCRKLE